MLKSLVQFMLAYMRQRSPDDASSNEVSNRLMELADSAAGYDPLRALELRRAAMATLAVVR